MEEKAERRKNERFVIVEDISKIMKDLKSGEIVVDLSVSGAKLLSLDPKRIGETISFMIKLPHELGSVEIRGKNIRSKMVRYDKYQLYETGIQFEGMTQMDKIVLNKFIIYLERDKIITEGREKIKELLAATRKLKKNILILKCNLNKPEEKNTTQ